MPHKSPSPLLSICIPTFNRAESLGLLLENIARECTPYINQLEIVISDNASTDHTEAVAKNRNDLPIVYSKNTTNLGGAGNVLTTTAKVATGEFVWIIGDDDLILPGGIERVLNSITKNPEIDYHYINFGWIKASLRDQIIKSNDTRFTTSLQTHLQCDLQEWKKLSKLEDLVFLPGSNPSALFCCIFSFATRRQFFVDALEWIHPTYCTDGSTIHLDDWYPHAMASIPPAIGKPIAYIGSPCILQSIGAWEWKEYLSKALLFGVHELFIYIEGKGFDRKSMNHLWRSYYKMAGRIFSRMQCNPEENKGLDIVLKKSIPRAASKKTFWSSFMSETRLSLEIDYEANIIAHHTQMLIRKKPDARIGIWGIQGRSYHFLKNNPTLHKNIVWITDKVKQFHGDTMDHTKITISPPASLKDANLDCLIIGTRRRFVNEIIREATDKLSPNACFISIDGLEENKGNQPT